MKRTNELMSEREKRLILKKVRKDNSKVNVLFRTAHTASIFVLWKNIKIIKEKVKD